MGDTRGGECDGAAGEHQEAEIFRQRAAGQPEHATEEIAAGDKTCRPQGRSDEVEHGKATPFHRAEANREGRDIADPVDETEGENEPGVIALEPGEWRNDAGAPAREAPQQPRPELPT